MDSSAHHRKADELAAKAEEYLGLGDGQETAAVWAAVAQVHATLALAAAAEFNQEGREHAAANVFPSSSPATGTSYQTVAQRPSEQPGHNPFDSYGAVAQRPSEAGKAPNE